MKRIAAFLIFAALAGCDKTDLYAPIQPAPFKADIRGVITSLDAAAGPKALGVILVEGAIEADTSYDRAYVSATASTAIREADGAALNWSALKEGDRVEAQFIGPVAESYPVQATAKTIVRLETGGR